MFKFKSINATEVAAHVSAIENHGAVDQDPTAYTGWLVSIIEAVAAGRELNEEEAHEAFMMGLTPEACNMEIEGGCVACEFCNSEVCPNSVKVHVNGLTTGYAEANPEITVLERIQAMGLWFHGDGSVYYTTANSSSLELEFSGWGIDAEEVDRGGCNMLDCIHGECSICNTEACPMSTKIRINGICTRYPVSTMNKLASLKMADDFAWVTYQGISGLRANLNKYGVDITVMSNPYRKVTRVTDTYPNSSLRQRIDMLRLQGCSFTLHKDGTRVP
jgi:hypothetical protein